MIENSIFFIYQSLKSAKFGYLFGKILSEGCEVGEGYFAVSVDVGIGFGIALKFGLVNKA